MQRIQNKALRFVYNTRWDDFITNIELQNRAKITSIDERLKHLKDKSATKFKENHLTEETKTTVYKFSDYEITGEPIFAQQNTILKYYKKWNLFNIDNN